MKLFFNLAGIIFLGFLRSYPAIAASDCGPKASVFERLLTDTEKVRLKCIDDFYAAQTKKKAKLASELADEIQNQKKILKRSAYKSDDRLFRVYCDFPADVPNVKVKIVQCRKDLALYNGLVAQLDHVMGWDLTSQKASPEPVQNNMDIPCPDEATLDKIQPVRYFRKNLYKIYERCRPLAN